MRELFQYALFLLVPFAVQLAVLFATENRFRPLRFSIPILTVAAGMVFLVFLLLSCLGTPPDGLSILVLSLAVVLCFTLSGLVMLGWALAWAAYCLAKFIMS